MAENLTDVAEEPWESEIAGMLAGLPSVEPPAGFIASMESDERRPATPIGQDGILYMELILYALRNPENRPRLVERQQRTHELNRAVVERVIESVGKPYPVSIDDAVTFIIAFDNGMQLLRLIEPDAYRPTQFSETLGAIHQLWVDGPS